MEIERAITFISTDPSNYAEDQMALSLALATSLGTRKNVSGEFYSDDSLFDILWEQEFIVIKIGSIVLELTQPEALHQAAILLQDAFDGGARERNSNAQGMVCRSTDPCRMRWTLCDVSNSWKFCDVSDI